MATATACAEDTSRHTRIYVAPSPGLPDLETAGEPEFRAMCERVVHTPGAVLELVESPAHVLQLAVMVDFVYTRIGARDEEAIDLEIRIADLEARLAAETARANRLGAALVEVQTELDNARAAHIRAANRKLRENQDAINSAPHVSLGGGQSCTQAMAAGDLDGRERAAIAAYERELRDLGAARARAWFDTSDVTVVEMGGVA